MSLFKSINLNDISDEVIIAPVGTTFTGTVKSVKSSSGVSTKSEPANHWAMCRVTVETSCPELMEVLRRDSATFSYTLMPSLTNDGALELNDNPELGALIKMFELTTETIQQSANEAADMVEEPEEGGQQAAIAKFIETILENLKGEEIIGTLGTDDYNGLRNVVTSIVPTT